MASQPSPGFGPEFEKEITQEIDEVQKRLLTVSIVGQTGVGKTSLLKALFNKALFTKNGGRSIVIDDVRPATRNPETYTIEGDRGQLLTINDLPGIGESSSADKCHFETYLRYFGSSDIVIWAIQADSRSTTFDAQSLDHLLKELKDDQSREQLMSKMVFVLTKVDTLLPSPWIMLYNSHTAKFRPGPETWKLIQDKQEFFQEQLIQPFEKYIVSRTHNDTKFVLDVHNSNSLLGSPFSADENKVIHRGFLKKEDVEKLSRAYPQNKRIFERLYDSYCPIYCSARFQFSLTTLVLAIFNRLGSDVLQNFKRVVDPDRLGIMSLDEARQLSNLLILNEPDRRRILDLEKGKFPDPVLDVVFYEKKVEKKKVEKQRKGPFGWFERKK